jgi:hypothetical protein
MTKGNELVKAEGFAIATQGDKVQAVLQANLGGDKINQFDLDKVSVPSGGGIAWEIPSLTGTDTVNEIEGVIVGWKPVRSLYLTKYTGGSEPPDCSSDDGITGFGDPLEKGIEERRACAECPNNQWGSDPDGTGKRCSERRLLFILRKNDQIPIMVVVPPSSLKNVKSYFLRLTQNNVPFYGVITGLTLEKDKSQSGITYSKVVFNAKGILTDEDSSMFESYAEFFGNVIKQVKFDPDLVNDNAS